MDHMHGMLDSVRLPDEPINRFERAELATKIVVALIAAQRITEPGQLQTWLPAIDDSFTRFRGEASAPAQQPMEEQKPAVNPKKSVFDDYLICLEDGKKFKSLKRHLSSHFGLTPEEYRAKWKLAPDYPMVAPNYSAARSGLAKQMGLGRKKGSLKKAA